jgi:hypothetical protein
MVIIFGDYNYTDINLSLFDGHFSPSNVTSIHEAMLVDGMAACDMGQVHAVVNQFLTVSDYLSLNLAKHHLAFILTCEVQYLKYISSRLRHF